MEVPSSIKGLLDHVLLLAVVEQCLVEQLLDALLGFHQQLLVYPQLHPELLQGDCTCG